MSEIWEHGDPLWKAAYFEQNEIEGYVLFRSLAATAGVKRTVHKRSKGQSTTHRIYAPLSRDLGDSLVQRFLLKETVMKPRNSTKKDAPIVVRHQFVVSVEFEGEPCLEDAYRRPELYVVGSKDSPQIRLANSIALLGVDMSAIEDQVTYLNWLELAHNNLGASS